MPTYRVKDGVRVVVECVPYSNGQTFSAEPEQVRAELDAGWLAPVVDGKAVHREQVEDKAVSTRRQKRTT